VDAAAKAGTSERTARREVARGAAIPDIALLGASRASWTCRLGEEEIPQLHLWPAS